MDSAPVRVPLLLHRVRLRTAGGAAGVAAVSAGSRCGAQSLPTGIGPRRYAAVTGAVGRGGPDVRVLGRNRGAIGRDGQTGIAGSPAVTCVTLGGHDTNAESDVNKGK